MLLNVAWSFLFFTLRRPDWAMFEVVLLWLSIAALIRQVLPASRRAATLLVPYLVWVAIAALLNWEVVRLNGPFGR
jgi:tryptophan-rich sensory protein